MSRTTLFPPINNGGRAFMPMYRTEDGSVFDGVLALVMNVAMNLEGRSFYREV